MAAIGTRNIPRQLLHGAVLASVLAVSFAPTALGKMPYFTVDVTPKRPVADGAITIVVRFWEDSAHTVPGTWDAAAIDDLIVVRGVPGSSDLPVHLRRVGPGRFDATVFVPAGYWTLVAFPDRSGWATADAPAGYPDRIPLTVVGRATLPPGAIAGAALAAGILIVAFDYSRRRLRSAALTRSSSDEPTPLSASAARDASRASDSE